MDFLKILVFFGVGLALVGLGSSFCGIPIGRNGYTLLGLLALSAVNRPCNKKRKRESLQAGIHLYGGGRRVCQASEHPVQIAVRVSSGNECYRSI